MKKHRNILITGGTGFIGHQLAKNLDDHGYHVTVWTRSNQVNHSDLEKIDFVTSLEDLPDIDWYGVINLAGEPLNEVRWSIKQKKIIVNSRVLLTQRLNAWIRDLREPPEVYISGSAIGWYGHWDDECLDEDSSSRNGFSNRLCRDWEAAANELADLKCRICIVRLGIVLGSQGGALQPMLLPAKLGLGGPMGSGNQWWSWIHIADTVRCFEMLLENSQVNGVFNLTAPNPVTQREFASALGKHLKRPAFLPLPGIIVKLMMGEFAEEVLLNGQRVLPKKLLDAGFRFDHPSLSDALEDLL